MFLLSVTMVFAGQPLKVEDGSRQLLFDNRHLSGHHTLLIYQTGSHWGRSRASDPHQVTNETFTLVANFYLSAAFQLRCTTYSEL